MMTNNKSVRQTAGIRRVRCTCAVHKAIQQVFAAIRLVVGLLRGRFEQDYCIEITDDI